MRVLELWGAALLALLAPIQGACTTAVILVLADLVTGVWAAKKRGEYITSGGLKRTVGKLALYLSAILVGFLTQKYLTGDWLPVCRLVTSLVGVTELKSVLENLDAIHGESVFKSLITRLVQSKADIPK